MPGKIKPEPIVTVLDCSQRSAYEGVMTYSEQGGKGGWIEFGRSDHICELLELPCIRIPSQSESIAQEYVDSLQMRGCVVFIPLVRLFPSILSTVEQLSIAGCKVTIGLFSTLEIQDSKGFFREVGVPNREHLTSFMNERSDLRLLAHSAESVTLASVFYEALLRDKFNEEIRLSWYADGSYYPYNTFHDILLPNLKRLKESQQRTQRRRRRIRILIHTILVILLVLIVGLVVLFALRN